MVFQRDEEKEKKVHGEAKGSRLMKFPRWRRLEEIKQSRLCLDGWGMRKTVAYKEGIAIPEADVFLFFFS